MEKVQNIFKKCPKLSQITTLFYDLLSKTVLYYFQLPIIRDHDCLEFGATIKTSGYSLEFVTVETNFS